MYPNGYCLIGDTFRSCKRESLSLSIPFMLIQRWKALTSENDLFPTDSLKKEEFKWSSNMKYKYWSIFNLKKCARTKWTTHKWKRKAKRENQLCENYNKWIKKNSRTTRTRIVLSVREEAIKEEFQVTNTYWYISVKNLLKATRSTQVKSSKEKKIHSVPNWVY